MLHTVAITETASPLDQQAGKNETMIVAPETVLARSESEAIAIVAAKHADAVLKGSPDRMVVQTRKGL